MVQLRPLTTRDIDDAHAQVEAVTTKVIDQVLTDTAHHLRGDVITENDLTILTRFWGEHVDDLLNEIAAAYQRGAAAARDAMRAGLVHVLTAGPSVDNFSVPVIPNEAADQLLANAQNRLVRTGNDVWEATRAQLHEGMLAGEGTAQLRERVMASGPFAAPRALTIARSEVGHAMNQGSIQQMRAINLPMTKEWIAVKDARTRPEHAEMDGVKIALDATFSIGFDPGDDYNCFVADTPVAYARLDGATKRWYEGDVLCIRFASGSQFTVTPNHPVLRADGRLVPAQLLQPGDYGVRGRFVGQMTGEPHIQNMPACIGDVYDAAELGGHAKRVLGTAPDFHGDGRDGEVDVVVPDLELWRNRQVASNEEVEQFALAAADLAVEAGLASRWSDELLPVNRLSEGGVGSERVAPMLVSAAAGGQQTVRLGDRSNLHAGCAEARVDRSASDQVPATKRGNGFALQVALDEIVSIDRITFSGHVYNLDTGLGWYLANGTVVGNCRCTTGFDVPDEDAFVGAVTGDAGDASSEAATGDAIHDVVPAKRSTLTGTQSAAVHDYTTNGYDWTNDDLRENKGDLSKIIQVRRERIQAMDSAMQPTTREIRAYRGISDPAAAFGKGWWKTDDMTGLEFTDHAYVSVTTKEDMGASYAGLSAGGTASRDGGVLLEVRVPPGHHALDIDDGGEHEIILKHGQHFRVLADDGWVQVQNLSRNMARVRRLQVEIVSEVP